MKNTFQVYEITLEPHESFVFYRKDGKLINTSSLTRPIPTQPTYTWDNHTKSFNRHNPPNNIWFDKVHIPYTGVAPADLEQYIIVQGLDIAKLIASDDAFHCHNIIIAYKNIDDNLLAVGIAALDVITERRNYQAEDVINRHFQLKAFW